MKLRLVSIDIGQPGIGVLLGFHVLDAEGGAAGRATVRLGGGGEHHVPVRFEVGREFDLVRLPDQPAAYRSDPHRSDPYRAGPHIEPDAAAGRVPPVPPPSWMRAPGAGVVDLEA